MFNGKYNKSLPAVVALGVLFGVEVAAAPVDYSGSVAYTFRSLSSDNQDSTSHQVLGNIYAHSYLWEPWLAQVQGGVTLALDNSELDDGTTSTSTDSQLVTGELGLNVLPQSKTPFRLRYLLTDSRVSDVTISNPLVTLGSEEFTTSQLELNQSYITEAGNRLQARVDLRDWESDSSGTYSDTLVGMDADWKPANQHVTGRASFQTTEHSLSGRQADNLILDVDHYYYPNQELRLDSKVSHYSYETSFDTPISILPSSTTEINQVSSYAFWRPVNNPWTVSGGLRVYDISSQTSLQDNGQSNITGTAGAFYQMNTHLRFDLSASLTYINTYFGKTTYSRERGGVLYQSDLHDTFLGTYQWYSSAALENRDDEVEQTQSLQASLGHETDKTWRPSESSYWRLSLNQALSENLQSGDADTEHRLDHSASLGWNQTAWKGTTMVQLTLSDSRNFGVRDDEQQLVNFQASRNQSITRNSLLSGNITLQAVRYDFYFAGNEDTTTTVTGDIDYQHNRLFGLPLLRFRSHYFISQASSAQGLDRAEWENRLDYQIGMLDTSLSLRNLDNGSQKSDLFYFRVARRF